MKLLKEALGNSMYHLAARLVSVFWKRWSLTESSFKEFGEHHKWKVITWFDGSSLGFPLDSRMLYGSLCGNIDYQHAYKIGSLVSRFKYGNFKVPTNGNYWFKSG